MDRKLLVAAALATASVGSAAQAQLIVGNDQSGTATIYNVDVGTGVATPIYSGTGADAKAWGMAYDAANNLLYWNNGSTLFRSPLSGSLTPQNLGTININGAAQSMVSLSFDGGKLYGTKNIATEAVYEIDTSTLQATQLFAYNTAFDFGGLEHDATTGLLYGLNDSSTGPGGRGLFEIDVAGQTQTLRAPYPAGETDIDALAVNNGLAYYVTDGNNLTQPFFYVYDVATGAQVGTLPSPFTGSGTFSGATFAAIPEPASLGLVAAGGLLALRRRR